MMILSPGLIALPTSVIVEGFHSGGLRLPWPSRALTSVFELQDGSSLFHLCNMDLDTGLPIEVLLSF